MEEDLSIQFELPMLKASGFIGYIKAQLPNYVIFLTDFTDNKLELDSIFSYDKTKPTISVVIRNCDILNTKCWIEMSNNADTIKVIESMGYKDENKIKLYYLKEWD